MHKNKYYLWVLVSLLGLALVLTACGHKTESDQVAIDEFNNQVNSQITAVNAILLQEYLKENISTLSPTKEVLGGKFYLTNLEYENANNAIASYEDGHIALKAQVNFEVKEKQVKILGFEIIEQ